MIISVEEPVQDKSDTYRVGLHHTLKETCMHGIIVLYCSIAQQVEAL